MATSQGFGEALIWLDCPHKFKGAKITKNRITSGFLSFIITYGGPGVYKGYKAKDPLNRD